jgi:ubiquinone/menaquinone biosynthesis C-methylase UbiE
VARPQDPDADTDALLAELGEFQQQLDRCWPPGRAVTCGGLFRRDLEGEDLAMAETKDKTERWRRYWDKHSKTYDRRMGYLDRRLFGDTRAWVCSKARGDVLEVAIGTGLNLPHYPADVRLTGVEFSPAMLELARRRAAELGRDVELREGDAHRLDLPDASFDTVVSTFSLCAIPDEQRAITEMVRVLRPGGTLLLADHVAGSAWPVRAAQRLVEVVSVPLGGEHFLRRPLRNVQAAGLVIKAHDRFKLGIIERLAACKPGQLAS